MHFALALDTPRTLDSVLRESGLDGRGIRFETTQEPLRTLTTAPTALPVSGCGEMVASVHWFVSHRAAPARINLALALRPPQQRRVAAGP